MKTDIRYVIRCKSTGTYNGPIGKPVTELKHAALFLADQVVQYSDVMQSNFEFVEIAINDGVRTVKA
jgi:hypothetical protein